FAARFEAVKFVPPHATWPVAPVAFEASIHFTPRELLRAVDTHVKRCLRSDQVTELTRLEATRTVVVEQGPPVETTDFDPSELDWAFRAIAQTHHHVAVLNRMRKAANAAGLAEGAHQRHLVFLRTDDWNKGPKTRELTDMLEKMRGVKRDFTDEDARTLIALR